MQILKNQSFCLIKMLLFLAKIAISGGFYYYSTMQVYKEIYFCNSEDEVRSVTELLSSNNINSSVNETVAANENSENYKYFISLLTPNIIQLSNDLNGCHIIQKVKIWNKPTKKP